jgi:predicted DNA-binding transcriptional regulator AlpA
VTTTENLRAARKRVLAKGAQELAARQAGTGPAPRVPEHQAPPATPGESRPNARATAPPLLLSRQDLRDYYGINYSRSWLWKMIVAGKFPAPVAFGPELSSRKAWRRDDIELWIVGLKEFPYGAPTAAA